MVKNLQNVSADLQIIQGFPVSEVSIGAVPGLVRFTKCSKCA